MEPNKLERDFKEKLEKRTIQPGEMAWDRLDAMLSVAEKKKKPNRAWLYMAASFLVFATLGALFLGKGDSNDTIIKQDAVVNQEQPAPVNTVNETVSTEPEVIIKEEIQVAEVKQSVKTTQKTQNTGPKTVQIKNITPAGNGAIAQATNREPVKIIAEQEAENLVAQVLTQETPKKKPTITVDPNSLLSSVEGELDESFRDKAFQGVVKNFNAVKTAVANRNYQ